MIISNYRENNVDLLQDNDVPIGLEDWNNTCRHSKFIDFLKKIFREK